ncbi:DUF389 domain-containing protein [Arcticibacter sp. MXS-1]|uniref:DUF389 domain-containing protein n=1 Tax=Arcticibacter sp. MXS-1 TaxID=3341726 RepID=UPI0035A9173F
MKKNKNRAIRIISIFISRRFNLHLDKADEDDVILSITKGTEFVGANLWALIFAIFIASIGLNVNSTAVIIGAMLISPLMGPIMGIGLGLGTNNFELIKKGARNLLIATLISIATSALYFWITPLHDAQSELLARTTPSLWDVFIAFFGGLAGIVAGTRKEKSNVIPGVAIATALMPPLCTAGYGIASGNFYYFIGALYLYSINTVFIGISTFLIVRFLKFKVKHFENKMYEKKVSRYIITIITITILPSIYLAYRIVDKSIFENNARNFVSEQFQFKNTQVVNRNFNYSSKGNEIDLLLIGYELPERTIDSIRKKIPQYKLGNTKLVVRQGLNAKQEIDFSQIKASILEDVIRRDSTASNGYTINKAIAAPELREELRALYPDLLSYSINNTVVYRIAEDRQDTLTLVAVNFRRTVPGAEQARMRNWLQTRLNADSLRLIIE